MLEFFQAYGSWILFGLFFLIMVRMHGSGGGCGMGRQHHTEEPTPKATGADEKADQATNKQPAAKRSGGCH